MLAEQLALFAEDFLAEWQSTGVGNLLQKTIDLLQWREKKSDAEYSREAGQYRAAAAEIIANTYFAKYPAEWRHLIERSEIAPYLPSIIAQRIIDALPSNAALAPVSSELRAYQTSATNAFSMLSSMRSIARAFKIEHIEVPPGVLGVVVRLPMRTFGHEAKGYGVLIGRFADLISAISVLTTGEHRPPVLLYTSTSEPNVILSTVLENAGLLLGIYGQFLDAVIKAVEVYRAYKTLRETMAVEEPSDASRMFLEKGLSAVLEAHGQGLDDEKRAVARAEIINHAVRILPAIKDGARLNLVARTAEKTTTTLADSEGKEISLTSTLELVHSLEIKLDSMPESARLPFVQAVDSAE